MIEPGTIRVTLLGTGTSHGVPMIGCSCAVCTSGDPHDRRTRTSAYVETPVGGILIDSSPELRLQCIASGISRCDAVLYTHHHIDHVAGLDDLRSFSARRKSALPCYGLPETLDHIRRMFPYAVDEDDDYPSVKPQLALHAIECGDDPATAAFDAAGVRIVPVPLLHGALPVLGFRIGGFAYCTDVSRIPDESWELLANPDVLVLDALRKRPHPTHFNLEQAVDAAARIGARQTYFTHIAHELGHEATNAELPERMRLGFDGQTFIASQGGRTNPARRA